MSSADRLYTPDLLALTLRLADYPWDETLPLTGEARSRSCRSTLAMGLLLDGQGRIDAIGLRARPCAVRQARAALFAAAAKGKTLEEIEVTAKSMEDWLADKGPLPDWPGLDAIEAARAFPGRHGAMMLPWQAALAALSSERASV